MIFLNVYISKYKGERSANVSEAAATDKSRTIIADSIVEFIVEHGFNGSDLDWKCPITGGGPGTYQNSRWL